MLCQMFIYGDVFDNTVKDLLESVLCNCCNDGSDEINFIKSELNSMILGCERLSILTRHYMSVVESEDSLVVFLNWQMLMAYWKILICYW